MTTEKSDSMGDRLDSVLEEIDILGSKAKQFHQGNVRIASLTIDLNLIEIRARSNIN